VRLQLGTATALAVILSGSTAYAADMGVPARLPAPPPPPQFSWSGCYVGGNAGLGAGETQWQDPAPDGNIDALADGRTAHTNMSGAVVGGQVGCDVQFYNNWVAGIAGSFDSSNIAGTNFDQFNDTWSLRNQGEWYGTITGRIGAAFGGMNNILLYTKGGVVFARNQFEIENSNVTLGTPTDTRTGWTLGGGLEWAFAPNWSAFIETDYYGFGFKSENFDAAPAFIAAPPIINVKQSFETLTLGVNYRFGSGWTAFHY
jgi:outer membrane immunogenic protein